MRASQIQKLIKAHATAGRRFRSKYQKYLDWYLAVDDREHEDRFQDRIYDADEDDLRFNTNYPYAYIDTMIAGVCPTNPQVTIQSGHPDFHKEMKNRERWVNAQMRRNRLHKRGWRAAAHAAISGFGMTKTVWEIKRMRPRTYVVDPRRVIWDEGVEDWEDISFIGEAVVLRSDQFRARTRRVKLPGGGTAAPTYSEKVSSKAKFGPWPQWLGRGQEDMAPAQKDAVKNAFEFVVVWEFYDFVTGTYFHVLDNVEEPLLETELPYQYVRNPYDLITFNDNLEDTRGLSDVQLIERAQERLNEIDAIQLKHAHRTIPAAVIDEDGVDDPAALADALQNITEPGSTIRTKLTQNRRSIGEVISYTQSPTLPPGLDQAREKSSGLIEFILALPAFMRGAVGQGQVATEFALADSGVRTRNGRRIVAMSEWQASVARKYINLLAEMWPSNQPIPIRDPGSPRAELLYVDDFAFEQPVTVSEEWYMLCDAVPYSPAENSRLVRLQKWQQWAPLIFEHPNVDKTKAMKLLLEELEMIEVYDESGGQPPQPIAGQPGAPGQAGTPGNDIASGDLPPELRAQNDAFQAQFAAPGVSEERVE